MRITRVIGVAIIVATSGFGSLNAQTLRNAAPPAEFPAPSFKGKQYVDSKGCVYIRAGIDGNVTWVPRVNRQRKQICGYQPTGGPTTVAGGGAAAPVKPPVQLTVDPVAKPAPKTVQVQPSPTPVPAPKATVQAAPSKPVTLTPRPSPVRVVTAPPAPKPRTKPRATVATAPKPAAKPAAKPRPVAQAASPVPPDTRVVRRHIYDRRQNTANVQIPNGYRSVWRDDRLNKHRAERTLRPGVITNATRAPAGYRTAWNDGRLNQNRGELNTQGNAQTNQIWTQTVPRRLVPVATRGRIVTANAPRSRGGGSLFGARLPEQPQVQTVARLSTRSAPAAKAAPAPAGRYVRVATYTDAADARTTARAFSQRGLPTVVGTVRRNGKQFKAVLAGPFTTVADANSALAQVKKAGFPKARIIK